MLAIGDALAVGLTSMLGTTAADFRRYHPVGSSARGCCGRVISCNQGDALPMVAPDLPMQEAVITMSAKGFGVAFGGEGRRGGGHHHGWRHAAEHRPAVAIQGRGYHLGKPISVSADMLASDALALMSAHASPASWWKMGAARSRAF